MLAGSGPNDDRGCMQRSAFHDQDAAWASASGHRDNAGDAVGQSICPRWTINRKYARSD